MNDLVTVESDSPATAVARGRLALEMARDNFQRMYIADQARAYMEAARVLKMRDVEITAATLMSDAERAVVKNAPKMENDGSRGNQHSGSRTSATASNGIDKDRMLRMRKAHESLDDETYEKVKEEIIESGELPSRGQIKKKADKIKHENAIKVPPENPPDLPSGLFDVLLVDPPWRYGYKPNMRSIELQYPTMSIDEIKGLEIPSEDNAVLYLWSTATHLASAIEVMAHWGFEYKACMVWVKDKIGMGNWVRYRHEMVLIGVKGKFSNPLPADRVDSVIEHPRMEHSVKPQKLYEIIEQSWPNATKIEMFARSERKGWTSWGHQA